MSKITIRRQVLHHTLATVPTTATTNIHTCKRPCMIKTKRRCPASYTKARCQNSQYAAKYYILLWQRFLLLPLQTYTRTNIHTSSKLKGVALHFIPMQDVKVHCSPPRTTSYCANCAYYCYYNHIHLQTSIHEQN